MPGRANRITLDASTPQTANSPTKALVDPLHDTSDDLDLACTKQNDALFGQQGVSGPCGETKSPLENNNILR